MSNNNNFFNRVFGIIMVKSSVSNYNADFAKQPRTLPSGTVYATDKALKYTVKHLIKKYYENNNDAKQDDNKKDIIERKHNRVMYFRNYDENMKPRTLGETYKTLFGVLPKRTKENKYNEFYLFYFDGNDVKGLIPSKPEKDKALSPDYWKALKEDEAEKFQFKSKIDTLFKDKKNIKKISQIVESEDVKKIIDNYNSDQDKVFFYFDAQSNYHQLDFIDTEIQNTFYQFAIEIDNRATGGIDKYATLKNLLKCIDVRFFGATYADETNISIHGPVQITHGIDRYGKGSELRFSEQIMSPFRNSNEKSIDNDATTLGTQFQLEEGHYVHHFSVNPSNLNTHNQNLKDDKKAEIDERVFLDEQDINILKEGLKKGVTDYDSTSKKGSENELFLWIELKENSMLVLPNLQTLVSVNPEKENDKTVIDLSKIFSLLENIPKKKDKNEKGGEIGEELTQINKIQLGYNDPVTKINGLPEGLKIQGVTIEICSLM